MEIAATDAELKGADIEKVRQGLSHSRPDTTRIYQRADSEATAEVAVLRFGKKEWRTEMMNDAERIVASERSRAG